MSLDARWVYQPAGARSGRSGAMGEAPCTGESDASGGRAKGAAAGRSCVGELQSFDEVTPRVEKSPQIARTDPTLCWRMLLLLPREGACGTDDCQSTSANDIAAALQEGRSTASLLFAPVKSRTEFDSAASYEIKYIFFLRARL